MPSFKKGAESRTPVAKKSGWAEVAKRQAEQEAQREARESLKDRPREFWIRSGESAIIQFLQDEPYVFDGHSIENRFKKFEFQPCQLTKQRHCLMCREGLKMNWRAAFTIIDYRGSWVKGKKDGEGSYDGKPVERLWIVSQTLLGQIQAKAERSKKPLSEMVFEITRTGAGKNDTSYNLDIAFDEDDRRMEPMEWDKEINIRKALEPLDDEQLEALGFEQAD